MSRVPLDELVEQQISKIASNKDPRMPYIGLEHIAQGEPRLLGAASSTSSTSVNSVFSKDDILFGKLRPNLKKSVRAPFDGYCSTDILVLRSRDGTLPSFTGHVFQWERVFAAAVATAAGTKMPRTAWSDLRLFRVCKPSTEADQARIAYVLDTIDEAIQKTAAVIAKLKQIRVGMLHDLLTYGLDQDGKLRDPVAHPEQFKDSELGRIPNEWEVITLGDSLSMQAGDFLSSDRISLDGDYPVYGGNGIRGYTTIFNTEGPLALIGRQGALCGNVLIASGRFYATEHAVVVRPRAEMDVHWLAAYLTSMDLNRYSESSAQPGISVNKISFRMMLRPQFSEQALIGSALTTFDQHLHAEQAALHKFHMLKAGLMDDLLSGNVAVPEDLLPARVPA